MSAKVTPLTERFPDLEISGADLSKHTLLTNMKELVEAAFTNLHEAFTRQEAAIKANSDAKGELNTKRRELEQAIQKEVGDLVSLHGQISSFQPKSYQTEIAILQEQTKERIAELTQKINTLQAFLDHHTHDWNSKLRDWPNQRVGKHIGSTHVKWS